MTFPSSVMLAWNPSTPHLPELVWMTWALPVAWALVLGVLTCGLTLRLPGPWRWGLTWAVMVWTLSGGVWSPAYGLGLAFGSPSLMSAVLCTVVLLRSWRKKPTDPTVIATPCVSAWTLTGVALGWVLLLDTLALWPQSVYAWGFGFAALAGILCVTLVVWMTGRGATGGTATGGVARVPTLVMLVLMLYIVTRLPTGNVWDALLDPWLWVVLQITALRRWMQRGQRG